LTNRVFRVGIRKGEEGADFLRASPKLSFENLEGVQMEKWAAGGGAEVNGWNLSNPKLGQLTSPIGKGTT